MPAPAGAVLVMLPVYLVFLGAVEPSRTAAFVATGFTVLVAFLLVSRLPVYSGKSIKIPGDRVLPVILAVVLYRPAADDLSLADADGVGRRLSDLPAVQRARLFRAAPSCEGESHGAASDVD